MKQSYGKLSILIPSARVKTPPPPCSRLQLWNEHRIDLKHQAIYFLWSLFPAIWQMSSLSFPPGLFLYKNVRGLNNNTPHQQTWGGVVGCKVPDSGFPRSLRNESREFCYSLTAVFGGKEMEREQMFWVPLTKLISLSQVWSRRTHSPAGGYDITTRSKTSILRTDKLGVFFFKNASALKWVFQQHVGLCSSDQESNFCLQLGSPLREKRR